MEIQQNNYRRIKSFLMYNANYSQKTVSLKGGNQDHCGCITVADAEMTHTTFLRLQFGNGKPINFLTEGVLINNQKIYPFSYFSLFQFQSNIIDIPFNSSWDDFDFKIPIKFMNHVNVHVFGANNPEESIDKYNPSESAFISFKNKRKSTVEVDILNLLLSDEEHPFIEIIDKNIQNTNTKFSLLRLMSSNPQQYYQEVHTENGTVKISEFLSLSNFQDFVEVPVSVSPHPVSTLKMKILPETTVIIELKNFPTFKS